MSLSPTALLKPRETLETYNTVFENAIQNLDADTIFADVHGLEVQKRILMDAIRAHDPIHHIIIGPPGNGKSLFLKCILKAFPDISKWIDSTTSSGIGMIERILDKGHKLRFLLVDEIEKFNKNDRETFLGFLEGGNVTRDLAEYSSELSGLKIWLFATCNDIKTMHRKEKPLLNRCDIIEVPELDYKTYLFVACKRLQKEKGIRDEEIAKYIAQRVHSDLGREMDMRKCIRLARKSYARALDTREDGTIAKDVVDQVVADNKVTMYTF
jgi:chromosomal replication initiation ATPase DnaA